MEAAAPPPEDGGRPAARSRRWPPPRWLALGATALVGGVLLGVLVRPGAEPRPERALPDLVRDEVQDAIEQQDRRPPTGVTVYDAIRRPLVLIRTSGTSGPGLGSGVVVNEQGHILTALHVVDGAATITVAFSDGTESSASVTTTDREHDVAVLAPAALPEVVVPAVLAGGARIGDEVFAVGHPLGLTGSLSAGVVSGLDRTFPLTGGRTIGGMIQFDAAVNPGNSGGPLLNRKGQVIGIVTGLATSAGDDDFIGIGFAAPITTAGGAAGAPAR